MSAQVTRRDYSLVGRDSKYAEEHGLASAEWYACPIPRKRLKELMQRRDGPAIRDTLLWFALLGLTGWLGWHFWGTWWCRPRVHRVRCPLLFLLRFPLARMRPSHRLQDHLDERCRL